MTVDPNEWLNAEKEKLKKKGKYNGTRTYLHFDPRTTPDDALELLSDPSRISSHPFTPFLSFKKELRRYKYRHDTEKRIKTRLLSYASHTDAYIYSWYAYQLQEPYEKFLRDEGISDSVLAYRSLREDDETRSTIDYAHEVFEHIRQRGSCAVVTLDVTKFFDTVQHGYLKRQLMKLIGVERLPDDYHAVFRSLSMYTHVMLDDALDSLGLARSDLKKKSRLCHESDYYKKIHDKKLLQTNPNYRHGTGIPQGSPISGILSNIYMSEIDREIGSFVKGIDGLYRRYCDDIVIICDSDDVNSVVEKMEKLLQDAHLEIQTDKTEVTYFRVLEDGKLVSCKNAEHECIRKPIQYLGFEFDGTSCALRSSTVARYMRRMKHLIQKQSAARRKNFYKAKAAGKNYRPQLNRKAILKTFSHLGRRNLITYAKRADAAHAESSRIYRQMQKMDKQLKREIEKEQNKLDVLS